MKMLATVALSLALSAMLPAQTTPKPAEAKAKEAAPQLVTLPQSDQAAVDSAWKDVRIAQLSLQLVIEHMQTQYGVVYDVNQHQFYRLPKQEKEAEKPAEKK